MIKGFYHVGIAVHSIDDTLKKLQSCFQAVELRRNTVESMGQVSCMVQVGEAVFELMEPTRPDGVIGKFLASHGEGIHHISLHSDDLDQDLSKLEENNVRVLSRAKGQFSEAAFTHPKSLFGVLFEVSQPFAD